MPPPRRRLRQGSARGWVAARRRRATPCPEAPPTAAPSDRDPRSDDPRRRSSRWACRAPRLASIRPSRGEQLAHDPRSVSYDEAMKIHRAIVLVVMMLIALGAFVLLTAAGIASFDGRSLIALIVVLVAAAISGVAFSWKRYSRRS